MVELKRALSLMPMARIAVITRAITKAGMFQPSSTPKILGASSNLCALSTSCGDCAAMISVTLLRNAWVPGRREESEAWAICRATIFSAARNPVQWS